MGYFAIFLGLQYQNNVAMLKQIETDRYEEAQTVTIKIPIAVPYMSDSPESQRVDGMFEHKGEFYRLVKQWYARDTLTVICVKDFENKRIHQALSNYVKTFSDKATHQRNSKSLISFIKDYVAQGFSLHSTSSGWIIDIVSDNYSSNLISTFVTSVIHPPEHS